MTTPRKKRGTALDKFFSSPGPSEDEAMEVSDHHEQQDTTRKTEREQPGGLAVRGEDWIEEDLTMETGEQPMDSQNSYAVMLGADLTWSDTETDTGDEIDGSTRPAMTEM